MLRFARTLSLIGAASIGLAALSACTTTNSSTGEVSRVESKPKVAKEDESKDSDNHAKRVETERKMEIARRNLAKARLAAEHSHVENEAGIEKAEQDLHIAQAKLEHLEQHEAPNRLARARLDLQYAQDRYTEAQEELQQLELMYGEEEFADKTKEIVIERSRRRLERSQENLQIRQKDLDFLQSQKLPLEVEELRFKLEQARMQADKAKRDARAAELDKEIAILSAETEIVKLEFQLEDLDKEG